MRALSSTPCVLFAMGYSYGVVLMMSFFSAIVKKLQKVKDRLKLKLPANDFGKATDFLDIKGIQGYDFKTLAHKKHLQSLVHELCRTEHCNIAVSCEILIALSTVEGDPAEGSFPYRRVVRIQLYIAMST